MSGQSAMEYLTTYGWAILIIVVVLSVLVALGVFNPNTYVSDTCTLPAGFECQSSVLASNGMLTFTISQFTSTPIVLTAIGCSSNQSILYNKRLSPKIGLRIGGNVTLSTSCYQGNTIFNGGIGNVYHGYVVINYTNNVTGLPALAIGGAVFKVKQASPSTTSTTSTSTTSTSTTTSTTSTSTTSTSTTTSTTSTSTSTTTSTTTIVSASTIAYAYVSDAPYCRINVVSFATDTIASNITGVCSAYGVSIAPNGAFAYTSDYNYFYYYSGYMNVVNTSTKSVATDKLFTTSAGSAARGLFGISIAPNGAYAYATDIWNDTISIINISTKTIIGTIPVSYSSYATSIAPNGAFAYASSTSGVVEVINTSTKTVTGTITGLEASYYCGISIAPNDAYAYVTNYGNSTVSIINTSTKSIVGTITGFHYPYGVSIAPNGAYAYVANVGNNNVSIVNTSTKSVVGLISISPKVPYCSSIAPNGAYAYVGNNYGQITIINTSTKTVISNITGATPYYGLAFAPDGAYALTSYYSSVGYSYPGIHVLSTATNTLTATFYPAAEYVNSTRMYYGVSIAPNGAYAYATDYNNNTVSIINTSTETITGTITGFSNPYLCSVSIAPNGAYAYVTNYGNNTASIVNTSSKSITGTISAFHNPAGVAFSPAGTFAYVVNVGNYTVSIVNTSSKSITGTITGFHSPYGVAIASSDAYVTNQGNKTVSIIDTSTKSIIGTIKGFEYPYCISIP